MANTACRRPCHGDIQNKNTNSIGKRMVTPAAVGLGGGVATVAIGTRTRAILLKLAAGILCDVNWNLHPGRPLCNWTRSMGWIPGKPSSVLQAGMPSYLVPTRAPNNYLRTN